MITCTSASPEEPRNKATVAPEMLGTVKFLIVGAKLIVDLHKVFEKKLRKMHASWKTDQQLCTIYMVQV